MHSRTVWSSQFLFSFSIAPTLFFCFISLGLSFHLTYKANKRWASWKAKFHEIQDGVQWAQKETWEVFAEIIVGSSTEGYESPGSWCCWTSAQLSLCCHGAIPALQKDLILRAWLANSQNFLEKNVSCLVMGGHRKISWSSISLTFRCIEHTTPVVLWLLLYLLLRAETNSSYSS